MNPIMYTYQSKAIRLMTY